MSSDRSTTWQSLFAGLTGLDPERSGPAGRIYQEWESWLTRQASAARRADSSGQLAAAIEAARLARRMLDGAVRSAVARAGIESGPGPDDDRIDALTTRVEALEAEVARLRERAADSADRDG